jgi:hypothetical protein
MKHKTKKYSGWIPARAGQVFKDRKKEAVKKACRKFRPKNL